MARLHGSLGQVKMDPTGVGGATAVAVASLNAWTLDMSRAMVDVTAFGDTNTQELVGLPAYKGTLGGFFDTTDVSIITAALGNTPVFLDLIPSTLTATTMFSGKAYLDANVSVTATGAVTLSSKFSAAGNWTFTHP